MENILQKHKAEIEWETAVILAETGEQQNSCNCTGCVTMCKRAPCLGTPSDILKLIEAGHTEKLKPTLWAASLAFAKMPIVMVQAERTESGCVFLNEKNLCSLHDAGLKPTEGKYSCHSPNTEGKNLTLAVAETWENPMNNEIMDAIVAALMAAEIKPEK